MMKSILIFLMVATGAALHIGPGAGEHFAAPMVAPASRVPVKPDPEPGNACTNHGGKEGPVNGGFHCAYRYPAKEVLQEANATDASSRCCCYVTTSGYLYGETTTCFKWTDDTIKALLADSKLEHGHKKKDSGKDGNRNVKTVPWAERKGYAAIKHLVSHPHWCPDIEQKIGAHWCPDWHSANRVSAYQRSPIPAIQEKEKCLKAKADDDRRTSKCIDQQKPKTREKYTAAELVEKVDFDYHEDEMCCCYTYPDYTGLVGDTVSCYRMFHEDVVYVQDQLGLWEYGKNKDEDEITYHDEQVEKKKKGGNHSEKEARNGRKVLGLRIDEGGKYKCPKAHWEESLEITANAVAEMFDWPLEALGLKTKDRNDGGFSYPCPTKEKRTRLRTCAARILGPLTSKAFGFHAYYESVMEPKNSANSFWGCPKGALYWLPRLCY